jgi:hypothetical protein
VGFRLGPSRSSEVFIPRALQEIFIEVGLVIETHEENGWNLRQPRSPLSHLFEIPRPPRRARNNCNGSFSAGREAAPKASLSQRPSQPHIYYLT